MVARKLAENSGTSKRGRGKPFPKGVSGNPGGLSPDARKAADAARDLALSHGQELLPDGRTRARAALDRLHELGMEGNVPAITAYLDRVGYKPTENVRIDGDLKLAIARRVHQPDAIADNNG